MIDARLVPFGQWFRSDRHAHASTAVAAAIPSSASLRAVTMLMRRHRDGWCSTPALAS